MLIQLSQKLEFMTIFMFSRAKNSFLTLLLSYCVWVTSKIQVNFRYKRYSKVLMIESYRFLKFLNYLCFWGQGIHCQHSYWATMFESPRKSRSTSGQRGSQKYWWFCRWIFTISSVFMFSRSRNPLLSLLLSKIESVTGFDHWMWYVSIWWTISTFAL